MKKLSILLCLLVTCSLLLTACGQADINTPGSSVPNMSDASDEVSQDSSTESTDETTTNATAAEGTSVTEGTSTGVGSSATAASTSAKTSSTTKAKVTTTWPSSAQKGETALEKMIKPYISANPNVKEITDYNPTSGAWSNIKAITYDGAEINGKKTKVFAYIGFPEGASASKKVPAVVLVHGGGGHAFAQWVKIWNDRGYAAIAMDTTGYFPSAAGKGKAGSNGDDASWWNYGLYGPFTETGYVNAPNTDRMKKVPSQDIDEQWMYHAVVSTIGAHNILMTDSRVNISKIGICGISWGSVITSIAIGYDTRYAYAIPIYGSGYLEESLSYFGELFAPQKVQELWSAADRFSKVNIPTLWLAWVNDGNFSINANTRSYQAMTNPYTVLSFKQDWKHSHTYGWAPEEIYLFADSVCRGKDKMVTCATEPTGRNISFTINKTAAVTSVTAKAYYITEELSYSKKNGQANPTPDQMNSWKSIACTVNGTTITGALPAEAVNYYVEITVKTASGTYTTSTGLVDARA